MDIDITIKLLNDMMNSKFMKPEEIKFDIDKFIDKIKNIHTESSISTIDNNFHTDFFKNNTQTLSSEYDLARDDNKSTIQESINDKIISNNNDIDSESNIMDL